MTATVALIAVPGNGKKPFILIVSDSKSTDEKGNSINVKKIYDAGNALFTTAGTASNGYREQVSTHMEKMGRSTIEEKSEWLHQTNLTNMHSNNVDMWSILAQFDNKGNPCLSMNFVGTGREIMKRPIDRIDRNKPMFIFRCIGRAPNDLVDRLNNKLGTFPFSFSKSKKALEEYVKLVADRYPEDCNKLTQHRVLYS